MSVGVDVTLLPVVPRVEDHCEPPFVCRQHGDGFILAGSWWSSAGSLLFQMELNVWLK